MSKQERLVVIISIMASFVAFLDGSVINVALPAMVNDMGGGISVQQWIVDAYLLSLGSLILIAGSLSDLFGRKRIMALGLLGFGVASLLCAAAPNSSFLIGARLLQGAAGALLVPSSLALIMSNFKGPSQGRAIGMWTAWTGIAFLVGPLLGGFLVEIGSWQWIFAINIIPIALTLLLIKKLETKDTVRPSTKIDYMGAVLGAVGLGGPVYALIEQPNYGWDNPLVYGSMGLGLAALIAFVLYERFTPNAMLPLSLFSQRNFTAGNIATVAIYGALSIATFIISVFVQQVGGFSAFEAGMALVPVTVIMFFLSSRFGDLAGRFGPRLFMTAGPILAGIGFLTMLGIEENVNYFKQLLPGIVIFGLGLAITVAPLTSAILGAIDEGRAGIASAVNNAIARVAGLAAIAVLGIVIGSSMTLDGFKDGLILTAVLLFAGGIVSALGIRNQTQKP
jgi:EmrB/QacA subfamily drug resistance transporter